MYIIFFRLVNKKQQNILKYDVILEKRKERQARVSLLAFHIHSSYIFVPTI